MGFGADHGGAAAEAAALRVPWMVIESVRCVACPGCAFTFAADHLDTDADTYTCPLCGAVGDV